MWSGTCGGLGGSLVDSWWTRDEVCSCQVPALPVSFSAHSDCEVLSGSKHFGILCIFPVGPTWSSADIQPDLSSLSLRTVRSPGGLPAPCTPPLQGSRIPTCHCSSSGSDSSTYVQNLISGILRFFLDFPTVCRA